MPLYKMKTLGDGSLKITSLALYMEFEEPKRIQMEKSNGQLDK